MSAQTTPVKLKRSTKLLVVCASILFALFVGEIALRVIGYTYPVFYTTDEARGYALRPCMQGWYRKENEVYIKINCAGLRDRARRDVPRRRTLQGGPIGFLREASKRKIHDG